MVRNRTGLTLLLATAHVLPAFGQNDECSGALPLSLGSTPFDTTTATYSNVLWVCGQAGGPDLWYTYTATSLDVVQFDTCGSSYDTALQVFSGTCGSLTSVHCNNDTCGVQSLVRVQPQTIGDTFYVRVGGSFLATGQGVLNVSTLAPLANDECGGAIAVGLGTTAFDNSAAASGTHPWNCGFNNNGDLWFTHTAATTSQLQIDTCGTTWDTVVEVYRGSCGALTLADCNDNTYGLCLLGSATYVFPAAAGEVFHIRVGGVYGNSGPGMLNITEVTAPPNDDCVNAIPLALGAGNPWDVAAATVSPPALACGGNQNRDVWFEYTTATTGTTLRIQTCGGTSPLMDTILEVYSGTCGALVLEDCSDDLCVLQSRVDVPNVVAGQTYFVRLSSDRDDVGSGTLEVQELPVPVQACALNAGFESGTLAGWTVEEPINVFSRADVVGAGFDVGFGFFTTDPTEGAYAFKTGWDGIPGAVELTQDVTVSSGHTPLAFDYRAAWDLLNFGAGADRRFSVVVRDPVSSSELQRTTILTATVGTVVLDTGPQTATVDLAPFVGTTVRLTFEWEIPESFTGPAFFQLDNVTCPAFGASIGTPYCTANANSTGAPASATAVGSTSVATNFTTIRSTDMPRFAFGFFLASRQQGFVANPAGSQGNLCLGGSIGRYVGPGEVRNSGSAGEFELTLDLSRTPQPNGFVAITAGETWNFQSWFRDSSGGVATSNFSNGVRVGFD